jgi:hypothetical protein
MGGTVLGGGEEKHVLDTFSACDCKGPNYHIWISINRSLLDESQVYMALTDENEEPNFYAKLKL